MKRLILTAIVASLLLVIVAALPTGAGARKSRPWVICTTQWEPPQSAYRRKPRACDYHERGEPHAHAWIQVTRHVHWHYWNGRRALGHGKLGVSTYGPAPARIKLSRPRHVCGEKIFTKARFKVRIAGDTYKYSVRLDKCTR